MKRLISGILTVGLIMSTTVGVFACPEVPTPIGDIARSEGSAYGPSRTTELKEWLENEPDGTSPSFNENSLFAYFQIESGPMTKSGVRLTEADFLDDRYFACKEYIHRYEYDTQDIKNTGTWTTCDLEPQVVVKKAAIKNGYLMNNTGSKLNPKGTITRGEFALILANILDFKAPLRDMGQQYSDVQGTKYEKAVNKLTANGIFPGGEFGNFEPEKTLIREDFLVVMTMLIDDGHDMNDYSGDKIDGHEGAGGASKVATSSYVSLAGTYRWSNGNVALKWNKNGVKDIVPMWEHESDGNGILYQNPILRCEMVQILNNNLRSPYRQGAEASHIKNYTDVKPSDWYYDAMRRACV